MDRRLNIALFLCSGVLALALLPWADLDSMLQGQRLDRERWNVSNVRRTVDQCLVVCHVCHLRDLMVHLEEYGHARYVVDVGVIFSPLLSSCSDDRVTRLLRAVAAVERPDDPRDGLVRQELPDAVRGYDYKLVFWLQLEPHHLRVCGNSDRVSHVITERPAHGKARRILVLKPDPCGS